MDPLSVGASVVGLLSAGAKLSASLHSIICNVLDAPSLAQNVLQEVGDIAASLARIQIYLNGQAQADPERGSLILIEHILTTLTGCVTTYSELQCLLDSLNSGENMKIFDKLKWARLKGRISILVQRLQNHKSSLTLMLTILQCDSLKEAESSNKHLCSLVGEVLQSNEDLALRMLTLEEERSMGAGGSMSRVDSADGSLMNQSAIAMPNDFPRKTADPFGFAFDGDLQTSRVYNRAKRLSISSVRSSALYSSAMSTLSRLSLSEVSIISFYALPVRSSDLSNSHNYIFGEDCTAFGVEGTLMPDCADINVKQRDGDTVGADYASLSEELMAWSSATRWSNWPRRSSTEVTTEAMATIEEQYAAYNQFIAQEGRPFDSSRSASRAKLIALSAAQFQELSTDVYDEIRRRNSERKDHVHGKTLSDDGSPTFLAPVDTYHPKRNQARRKLAMLPPDRFALLVTDSFREFKHRLSTLMETESPQELIRYYEQQR
ncbi:MAG: hypothetical protein M1820_008971 [Bogoriella megaspora]|nr:MAG: hypothetical protein M1820_008971 [Bogoriella megaspora]